MRVWRALKALGCATLRDGVYLLPEAPEHASALEGVALGVRQADGSAEAYRLSGTDEGQEAALRGLFDRAEDYADIAEDLRALRGGLKGVGPAAAGRRLQALTRRFNQVAGVDFFPGEARRQTLARLDELRAEVGRLVSPDEPSARHAALPLLDRGEYRGRTWATRARPWVDRLASAWLIRRHIDPEATLVWLTSPADCRPGWLGFDFDGAAFSHTDGRVTFEALLASFGLEGDPGLRRLGDLVHYLDVGGAPVPEAAGVEALLAGLRAGEGDDDRLLARASDLFDWLLRHYQDRTDD
jgi:hypothetical protein